MPFPFSRGFKTELFSIFKSCLIVTIALYFIKPFGLEMASFEEIIGFGLVAFLISFLSLIAKRFLLIRLINEENWKVYKEIVRIIAELVLIIIGLSLYSAFAINVDLKALVILKFIAITVLFATIPISIRTMAIKNWLLKSQLAEAKELTNKIHHSSNNERIKEFIILRSDIVKEELKVNIEDLLYIESDKNYIKVILNENKKISSTLMRLSLVKAIEQIKSDSIIRCHRSYLININRILKVSGNSQGFKIVFDESLPSIPVSRTFKNEVIDKLKEQRA